jgi:hypothetical protein
MNQRIHTLASNGDSDGAPRILSAADANNRLHATVPQSSKQTRRGKEVSHNTGSLQFDEGTATHGEFGHGEPECRGCVEPDREGLASDGKRKPEEA